MGLDMYLYRKTYVKNWEHMTEDEKVKITLKGDRAKGIDVNKITEIVEEVGYWRKANAIHKWFVDNVQNGDDDCKEHYVDEDKLKELLSLVNKVLQSTKLVDGKINNGYHFNEKGEKVYSIEDGKVMENTLIAEELLPTSEGFFFGNTDYDEMYYNDLLETKKILEDVLKVGGDFYYHSSW
jgi:hypothetical protein